MKRKEILEYIGIIVTVIVGLIGSYGQIKDPQTSIIIFAILSGGILVYFLITYIVGRILEKITQIKKNTESIEAVSKGLNKIKEILDIRRELDKLQVKIVGLEQSMKIKGKRGVLVDPRWVALIIVIILFIIYMRSKGWF